MCGHCAIVRRPSGSCPPSIPHFPIEFRSVSDGYSEYRETPMVDWHIIIVIVCEEYLEKHPGSTRGGVPVSVLAARMPAGKLSENHRKPIGKSSENRTFSDSDIWFCGINLTYFHSASRQTIGNVVSLSTLLWFKINSAVPEFAVDYFRMWFLSETIGKQLDFPITFRWFPMAFLNIVKFIMIRTSYTTGVYFKQ